MTLISPSCFELFAQEAERHSRSVSVRQLNKSFLGTLNSSLSSANRYNMSNLKLLPVLICTSWNPE